MAATMRREPATVHVMARWCSGSFAHPAPSLCHSMNEALSEIEGSQMRRKGLRMIVGPKQASDVACAGTCRRHS